MSWLSDRLGTTGKTPKFIKQIGNVVGSAVVKAVPFGLGGTADKLFNISGTQPPSGGLQQIAQTTGANLEQQVNDLAAAQRFQSQLPVIAGVALFAFLLFNSPSHES